MGTVPIGLIDTDGRLRGADADQVASVADSMREVGLLHPVCIFRTQVIRRHIATDGYGLVSGLHRIKAAISLGWTEIEAHVVTLSDLQRQIAECDENLRGPRLTPAERALFTRRRKDAYEALHPETRATSAGGEGRHKDTRRQIGDDTSPRFTADTAAKTGHSERVIQRDAERGNKISDDVLAGIKGTSLDKGIVLDEIAKVAPEKQAAVVRDIAERRAVKPAPPILNDIETEEQWRAAGNRWFNRGSREWRERWLDSVDTAVFDRTHAGAA